MTSRYKYGGTIAVVAIIVLGALYYSNKQKPLYLAFETKVESTGANAFGSLLTQDGSGQTSIEDSAKSIAAPVAGFGGGGGVATEALAIDGGRIIAPPQSQYRYEYTGEEFTLDDAEVSVLRRIKGTRAAQAVSRQLSGLDFGVFDINAFNTKNVENMNFTEAQKFGYNVNINFTEGSISINENWEQWDHPSRNCRDQACQDKYRLTINDIPEDDVLMNITNEFLISRGISTKPYAAPEVDDNWRRNYEEVLARGNNQERYYIPETIQVQYPLAINGQVAYEQGGYEKAGMYVSVNIRFNRVSSVWGLTSQEYESSSYSAATDAQKIVQIAEAGGLYGYLLPPRDAKVIELGTPARVLMRMFNWQDGKGNELLVPALMFPVSKAPEELPYYQSRNILIPLAEELLVRDNGGGPVFLERSIMDTKQDAEGESEVGASEPAIEIQAEIAE